MGLMKNSSCFNYKQIKLDIFGLSQGLGLRPKLFCHAQELGLSGTLQNRGDRLRLILEGSEECLLLFLQSYRNVLPEQAKIESQEVEWQVFQGIDGISIIPSTEGTQSFPSIPADLATCKECWQEFFNSDGVRSYYPFLSCTLCGPRYSVFLKSPYDRKNTTFSSYELCDFCHFEYKDSHNRRFHAQTIACPNCGPRAIFRKSEGAIIAYHSYSDLARQVAIKLKSGAIFAFQGIGGFALVCDATHSEAIAKLRMRKRRPHQALAIMGKNLEALAAWVNLSSESVQNLTSQIAPIVIAPCLNDMIKTKDDLNPDSDTLGVMLPSNPFQYLLFGAEDQGLDYLVYTSGNLHGEPLEYMPEEALRQLSNYADYFLYCDRPIERPIDDSLIFQAKQGNRVWRSARGMTPLKSSCQKGFDKRILALGADLKNTFSIAMRNSLWTSPHQGDLENPKSFSHYKKNTHDFLTYLNVIPEFVVVDRHQEYHSSHLGRELSQDWHLPLLEIGHHRAHAAAAAFQAGWDSCLGLVYDGTGLGDDDTLWGGEIFAKTCSKEFLHTGGFSHLLLPGGTQAILDPMRILLGHFKTSGRTFADFFYWTKNLGHTVDDDLKRWQLIFENCDKGVNSPVTSSVGRLFDLVSVLLGAQRGKITYEAQAAIRLENMALQSKSSPNKLSFKESVTQNKIIIDSAPMLEDLIQRCANTSAQDLALDFHFTLAHMALAKCLFAREITGLSRVTLSGGVFNNEVLTNFLFQLFPRHHFDLFIAKDHCVGDASISIGQALLAREVLCMN